MENEDRRHLLICFERGQTLIKRRPNRNFRQHTYTVYSPLYILDYIPIQYTAPYIF